MLCDIKVGRVGVAAASGSQSDDDCSGLYSGSVGPHCCLYGLTACPLGRGTGWPLTCAACAAYHHDLTSSSYLVPVLLP